MAAPTTNQLNWPQTCHDGHSHDMGQIVPPLQVAGIKYWIAGDKGIAAGPVGTWYDFSGNANNITQGTNSLRPIMVSGNISNLEAVGFDGVDDFLLKSSSLPLVPSIAQAFTMICVMRRASTTGAFGRAINFANSANLTTEIGWMVTTNNRWEFRFTNDAGTIVGIAGANNTATTTPHVMTATWNATTLTHFIDGVSAGTAGPTGATTVDQMTLGRYGGQTNSNYADCVIGEFLIYDTALSTAQRQTVENYLGRKWDIRLT